MVDAAEDGYIHHKTGGLLSGVLAVMTWRRAPLAAMLFFRLGVPSHPLDRDGVLPTFNMKIS